MSSLCALRRRRSSISYSFCAFATSPSCIASDVASLSIASSSGTQGLSVLIGGLQRLLHLLNLLRLLLFCDLCAFPGGTQAAPLQGIPGQQDLLQLAIQLPGLDRAAGLFR